MFDFIDWLQRNWFRSGAYLFLVFLAIIVTLIVVSSAGAHDVPIGPQP